MSQNGVAADGSVPPLHVSLEAMDDRINVLTSALTALSGASSGAAAALPAPRACAPRLRPAPVSRACAPRPVPRACARARHTPPLHA